jgi:hypothetical protein
MTSLPLRSTGVTKKYRKDNKKSRDFNEIKQLLLLVISSSVYVVLNGCETWALTLR